ncbi:MAG: hypothetical protein R3E10_14540 [Gemmatimonadota bacterium]
MAETTIERARNELFSHINRCGVLSAAEEDQRQWMNETVDYLGERYPDLSDTDLRDLYTVGLRFCKPVLVNGAPVKSESAPEPSSVGSSN